MKMQQILYHLCINRVNLHIISYFPRDYLSNNDEYTLWQHYEQILFISANRVKVVTDAAEIEFVGEHIQVLALEKNELLMEGILSQVRFQHVQ